jgi:uracil-DNA glycosylase family 4
MEIPGPDCSLCPRLAGFRQANRGAHPGWRNAPVPSFGATAAPVLVVGLAPGLKGANATGRPFTGDHAGVLLYATLAKFGFSEGSYQARADDGLELRGLRITNAVRCVPPGNKPVASEIRACLPFLVSEMAEMESLRLVIALGRVAHDTVLTAFGEKKSAWPFAHGAIHRIAGKPVLVDSYHCSRYNTNTRRLTPAMFEAVFEKAGRLLNSL